MTNSFTNLGLTDASSSYSTSGGGCCGGGGCMCGSGTADAAATVSEAAVVGSPTNTVSGTTDGESQEFLVTGMTCGHCVSSVTEELGEIEGVDAVVVELNVGGASKVHVSASAPLDIAAVRAAVSEAGYELVGASA